jgi:single-strand DNA-binding protein
MNRNNVVLIGYVGRDLISSQAINGNKKISMRVATHHHSKNERGDKINHTVWHNVVAWEHIAEFALRSFVKGSKILVDGNIEYRVYPDKSGHLRYYTQIKANSLMNLDR